MLPDDAFADLGAQGTPGLAQLACGSDVALDHLGRRLGGCFTGEGSTRRENRSFL